MNESSSLADVLAELGYTTEVAGWESKHIIRDGSIVFTGRAWNVWQWLRDRGEVPW